MPPKRKDTTAPVATTGKNHKTASEEQKEKVKEKEVAPSPSPSPCVHGVAQVTKLAPDFSAEAVMPNGEFGTIKLSEYRGKYVVLFFYPLDFTFVCPTEIIDFSDSNKEFKKLNCEVLAASIDSKYCHLAWTKVPRKDGGVGALEIPLIADITRSISEDYGVLMDSGFDLRGLFIIDDKGIIRHATLNDPPVGRSVSEVLRLVNAYQHTDKYGEVCPSGWQPGGKTIKPNPKGAMEFFREFDIKI